MCNNLWILLSLSRNIIGYHTFSRPILRHEVHFKSFTRETAILVQLSEHLLYRLFFPDNKGDGVAGGIVSYRTF